MKAKHIVAYAALGLAIMSASLLSPRLVTWAATTDDQIMMYVIRSYESFGSGTTARMTVSPGVPWELRNVMAAVPEVNTVILTVDSAYGAGYDVEFRREAVDGTTDYLYVPPSRSLLFGADDSLEVALANTPTLESSFLVSWSPTRGD